MSETPESTGTDVAEVDTADITQMRAFYDPSLDFRKLALEATYFARGFRVVEKDDLLGIPFVVMNVTYREGYPDAATKVKGDYVSLECVVADAETMSSPQVQALMKQVRPDNGNVLTVYPNEPVVINDGGTGIRRTITGVLAEAGVLDPGGDPADDRRFDRPYSQWKSGADEAQYGFNHDKNGQKFRYVAMRGLRRSDYVSDITGQPATTFYFG